MRCPRASERGIVAQLQDVPKKAAEQAVKKTAQNAIEMTVEQYKKDPESVTGALRSIALLLGKLAVPVGVAAGILALVYSAEDSAARRQAEKVIKYVKARAFGWTPAIEAQLLDGYTKFFRDQNRIAALSTLGMRG